MWEVRRGQCPGWQAPAFPPASPATYHAGLIPIHCWYIFSLSLLWPLSVVWGTWLCCRDEQRVLWIRSCLITCVEPCSPSWISPCLSSSVSPTCKVGMILACTSMAVPGICGIRPRIKCSSFRGSSKYPSRWNVQHSSLYFFYRWQGLDWIMAITWILMEFSEWQQWVMVWRQLLIPCPGIEPGQPG